MLTYYIAYSSFLGDFRPDSDDYLICFKNGFGFSL